MCMKLIDDNGDDDKDDVDYNNNNHDGNDGDDGVDDGVENDGDDDTHVTMCATIYVNTKKT